MNRVSQLTGSRWDQYLFLALAPIVIGLSLVLPASGSQIRGIWLALELFAVVPLVLNARPQHVGPSSADVPFWAAAFFLMQAFCSLVLLPSPVELLLRTITLPRLVQAWRNR